MPFSSAPRSRRDADAVYRHGRRTAGDSIGRCVWQTVIHRSMRPSAFIRTMRRKLRPRLLTICGRSRAIRRWWRSAKSGSIIITISRPASCSAKSFIEQLKIAGEAGLPVIIHTREAWDDTDVHSARTLALVPGIMHCFTGDAEQAREALAIGLPSCFRRRPDLSRPPRKFAKPRASHPMTAC